LNGLDQEGAQLRNVDFYCLRKKICDCIHVRPLTTTRWPVITMNRKINGEKIIVWNKTWFLIIKSIKNIGRNIVFPFETSVGKKHDASVNVSERRRKHRREVYSSAPTRFRCPIYGIPNDGFSDFYSISGVMLHSTKRSCERLR